MNWISIKDQQPTPDTYILIAVRATNRNLPYEPFLVLAQPDGTFKDKWGFCETFKMAVDYWMPLPELPHDIR